MNRWARRYQRFWFDLEIPLAQLTLFRVLFFTLVGLEAFLQVTSAPRFASGFNVPHFPTLLAFLPAPTRPFMLIAYFAIAYGAFRFATDAVSRPVCATVAAGLGLTYFSSQLDSYQHHYLVFLLVFLCCFLSFREPARGPVARLLLVQVSFLYGWAAVAKLDPVWLDDSAIAGLVRGTPMQSFVERLGPGFVAIATLVVEIFLCVALQVRRLWPFAICVAVPFHVGIEYSGLEIGLFSYFMIAFYALLLPIKRCGFNFQLSARGPRVLRMLVPLAATGLILLLPFEEAWMIALTIGLAGLAIGLRYDRNAGHLAAVVALVLLTQFTHVTTDYFRFWGGSSRRLGKIDVSMAAYKKLTEIRPEYAPAWASLASLYRLQRRPADARAAAEQALRLDPQNSLARDVLRASPE